MPAEKATIVTEPRAVAEGMPKATEALNLAAFDKGYAYAMSRQEIGAMGKG